MVPIFSGGHHGPSPPTETLALVRDALSHPFTRPYIFPRGHTRPISNTTAWEGTRKPASTTPSPYTGAGVGSATHVILGYLSRHGLTNPTHFAILLNQILPLPSMHTDAPARRLCVDAAVDSWLCWLYTRRHVGHPGGCMPLGHYIVAGVLSADGTSQLPHTLELLLRNTPSRESPTTMANVRWIEDVNSVLDVARFACAIDLVREVMTKSPASFVTRWLFTRAAEDGMHMETVVLTAARTAIEHGDRHTLRDVVTESRGPLPPGLCAAWATAAVRPDRALSVNDLVCMLQTLVEAYAITLADVTGDMADMRKMLADACGGGIPRVALHVRMLVKTALARGVNGSVFYDSAANAKQLGVCSTTDKRGVTWRAMPVRQKNRKWRRAK
jgi:hypothetical protein